MDITSLVSIVDITFIVLNENVENTWIIFNMDITLIMLTVPGFQPMNTYAKDLFFGILCHKIYKISFTFVFMKQNLHDSSKYFGMEIKLRCNRKEL